MIKKNEFFRIKAEIFSKSEPGLILKSFVVLLNKFSFLYNYGWRFVDCLLIGLLFAACIDKAKYSHLVDSHYPVYFKTLLFYINSFYVQ